jgi:hypothetical protein
MKAAGGKEVSEKHVNSTFRPTDSLRNRAEKSRLPPF